MDIFVEHRIKNISKLKLYGYWNAGNNGKEDGSENKEGGKSSCGVGGRKEHTTFAVLVYVTCRYLRISAKQIGPYRLKRADGSKEAGYVLDQPQESQSSPLEPSVLLDQS